MEKQKDKKLTRKLWLQAGGLILTTLMSWISLSWFFLFGGVISVISSLIEGYFDKYLFESVLMEFGIVIVPLIITLCVIVFMFLLKADMNIHFKTHMVIGLVANLLCASVYFCLNLIAMDGIFYNIGATIINFVTDDFWVISLTFFVLELIIMLFRKVYKNPKAFVIYLLSNVGINLFLLFWGQILIIYSMI